MIWLRATRRCSALHLPEGLVFSDLITVYLRLHRDQRGLFAAGKG